MRIEIPIRPGMVIRKTFDCDQNRAPMTSLAGKLL